LRLNTENFPKLHAGIAPFIHQPLTFRYAEKNILAGLALFCFSCERQ
jgi:hypothetical protein